eukprot:419137_1
MNGNYHKMAVHSLEIGQVARIAKKKQEPNIYNFSLSVSYKDEQIHEDEIIEADKHDLTDVYKYYLSTICCCFRKYLSPQKFQQYHRSCYASILTGQGKNQKPMDRDINSCHGLTITEYLNLHKKRLDPNDIALLKKLSTNILFCKVCYRPFNVQYLDAELLTPFWGLYEIILYVPLVIGYSVLAWLEKVKELCENQSYYQGASEYDVQHEGIEYTNI